MAAIAATTKPRDIVSRDGVGTGNAVAANGNRTIAAGKTDLCDVRP